MSSRKRLAGWKPKPIGVNKKHKYHTPETENLNNKSSVPTKCTVVPPAAEWHFVTLVGETKGPVCVEELKQVYENGLITENTFVWKESFGGQWKKLKKVQDLASVLVKPDPFDDEDAGDGDVVVEETFKQEFEECQPSVKQQGNHLNQEILYSSQQCFQSLQNDVDLLDEFGEAYLKKYAIDAEAQVEQTFQKVSNLVEAYRQQVLENLRQNVAENVRKVEEKKADIQSKIDMLVGTIEATHLDENLVEAHQKLLRTVDDLNSAFKPGEAVQEMIAGCERFSVTTLSETLIAGNVMKFVSLEKQSLIQEDIQSSPNVQEPLDLRTSHATPVDDSCCSGKLVRSYSVVRRSKRDKDNPLSPRAIAFNPDTRMLYVADYDNHRIAVFGSRGGLVFCFGQGNAMLERDDDEWIPGTVAFPTDLRLFKRNLYVLDKFRIQVYTHSGMILKHMNLPSEGVFESFCVASNGHLFVSNLKSHRIHIFNCDGKLLKVVKADLWNPRFTRYWKGKVYVADGANGVTRRVNIFDLNGVFLERIMLSNLVERFSRIGGLAVSADHIYVSETSADRVLVLSKAGKLLGQWTIPNLSRNSFNRHAHVEWSDTSRKDHAGVVFVSDMNARMVHVYQ